MRPKYASKAEEGEILTTYGVSTGEDYRPSRRRIYQLRNSSSCAMENFQSDASLEAVDWQAPNISKLAVNDGRWRQRPTIDTCSTWRWMTRQLSARWYIARGVLMTASSILRRLLCHGLHASVSLYRIPLTANHQRLRLQWTHEHRTWQADWYQVVFSDESRSNLWNHDGRVRVKNNAGQRCLPERVIERHSGRKAGVLV